MQLTELSTRLDTVESSIKKDIRNILEILQQQQQQKQSITDRKHSDEISDKSRDESPQQIDENRLQRTQQTSIEKQNILMTSSYQRTESDFSFDQPQIQSSSHRLPTASTSQVHRSISQPECTNTATDKSLLKFVFLFLVLRLINDDFDAKRFSCFTYRCSKFSSFNQTLDDNEQWTAFAPIAKLESLDELDQVI